MENLEESVSSIDIQGNASALTGNVPTPSNTTTTSSQNSAKGSEQKTNIRWISVNIPGGKTPSSPLSQTPKALVLTKRDGGGKIVLSRPFVRFNPINNKRPIPEKTRGGFITRIVHPPPSQSSNPPVTPAKMPIKPSTTPSNTNVLPTKILPKPLVKSKPLSVPVLMIPPTRPPKIQPLKNMRADTKEALRSNIAKSLLERKVEMDKESGKKKMDNKCEKMEVNKSETRRRGKTFESSEKGKRTPPPPTMDSADDGIIFVETTKKKKIRFKCPSLEFEYSSGFAANFSNESTDLTTRPTSKTYAGSYYDECEDSVVQYLSKEFAKERELEEEEAKEEKNKVMAEKKEGKEKGKSKAIAKKLKESTFCERIIETPEDGRKRRERNEFSIFMNHIPSRIEQIMPFYRMHCIDGIIKAETDRQRENQRIISTRVNPNPNLPYVLSFGTNTDTLIHNYLNGNTVNKHRTHFTYSTDGDWSYCGNYFIACGTDKLVRIVSTHLSPPIQTKLYSDEMAVGVRFTQDRNIAIVAMQTGMIDFYDLRQEKYVRRISGLPNITCIDTNPLDWSKLAVGFENGMVTEYNFYDDHSKSSTHSYFQYFLPEMKSPIFNMLQFNEYDDFYDSSEVKCLRYCSSADSKLRNDLIVTKANRDKTRGDAAYKFSPERNKQVISYIPPNGLNISCATFAFNHRAEEETTYGYCESYIVAGTEEGTVMAFDAETGEIVNGGTAVIDDPSYTGNNDRRYGDMDREAVIDSYHPVRKYVAHEKNCYDPNPANRITAIDSVPDSYLGAFIVGGWGENPTLNVYRFHDYSHLEQYLTL